MPDNVPDQNSQINGLGPAIDVDGGRIPRNARRPTVHRVVLLRVHIESLFESPEMVPLFFGHNIFLWGRGVWRTPVILNVMI